MTSEGYSLLREPVHCRLLRQNSLLGSLEEAQSLASHSGTVIFCCLDRQKPPLSFCHSAILSTRLHVPPSPLQSRAQMASERGEEFRRRRKSDWRVVVFGWLAGWWEGPFVMQCCINNAKGALNSLLPWRPLCLTALRFLLSRWKAVTTSLVLSLMTLLSW